MVHGLRYVSGPNQLDHKSRPAIDDGVLAAMIVADLRLLMVGRVTISRKRIVAESHKRHNIKMSQ